MREMAAVLAVEGTAAAGGRMVSFEERFELVGLSWHRALEARYGGV